MATKETFSQRSDNQRRLQLGSENGRQFEKPVDARRQNTPLSPHPMNWKEFYQTGINNTTNVAISGGGEKSSFHLSYGFTKTKGVFLNNDFHRHNISFRGITELNRIFSMELSVKYAFSSAKNGASQGGWDWGNNVGMMTAYHLP